MRNHKFDECSREAIISPEIYCGHLHISTQRLAELIGVHLKTLLRTPELERVQDYMRDSLNVLATLVEANGGDLERAIYWFRNVPLTELGGETAERYVASGKARAMCRYITNLGAGSTG